MAAILKWCGMSLESMFQRIVLLLCFAVYSTYGGGCTFPSSWAGSWFQSGMPGLVAVNLTHIQSKGECAERDNYDKFLLYDKSDDCYRCMVIHEKHESVLQYKETYCGPKDSLMTICDMITGDAPLFSMFRKHPQPTPQPCPFRPAPFTFTYNRGSGDCSNPPSRAESCTDDSRLLLRYMACPDVPATESNVEELVCLATWKEGSTRYLVGQISQVQRRNSIASDEDTYRCFIYKGQHTDKGMTYYIAQSGDATCNGLSSPTDGSKTMRLTNSDDEHHRCHFPGWVVEHHKWFSLDHTHQYHFTTKNATLKILNDDGKYEEKRMVCHSILEHREKKYIKLVAHVTRGCESGHLCVELWHRGGSVLELRAPRRPADDPTHACAVQGELVTLVAATLPPARCPVLGRYSVLGAAPDGRRRRQGTDVSSESNSPECVSSAIQSVTLGCGAGGDTMDFRGDCHNTVYTCYASWWESGAGGTGGAGVVVAGPVARGPHTPPALCFIYAHQHVNDSSGSGVLSVSALHRSCDRGVRPGVGGDRAYNLTINGTCEQSSKYSAAAQMTPSLFILTSSLVVMATAVCSR